MPLPNYNLFRALAGVIFFLDLLAYLPYGGVCLGAGYWGARGVHRPSLQPLVISAWALASLSLVLGVYALAGAVVLWVLFRHYYVANRWKNTFRGGGAPGFMSHWVVMYILLFELVRLLDPGGKLSLSVLRMNRIDLGLILLCSGTYKSLSGFLRGEGMEYGLANPFWGYWFRFFRRLSPKNPLLRMQDIGAALTQVIMGICILIPPLRPYGGLICVLSFGYLIFLVRLGRLAGLMMVAPLLCLPDLERYLPWSLAPLRSFPSVATPDAVLTALHALVIAYIVVLPFVKVMQYLNLFGKRQMPWPLQPLLTRYANLVPIIMWRVFTPDVTNFFVRIYRVDRASGVAVPIVHEDTTYSYREFFRRWRWSMRFLHVTESIALTTVFTTLKYFRSQRPLFEQRLLDYAATLGCGASALLRFEYVAILKREQFEHVPVGSFTADLARRTVSEERYLADFDFAAPAQYSHIKETTGFGSYVPKA